MKLTEFSNIKCPHCGGATETDPVLAEKKDACYHKVRSRYKVWPSAYASGALVQCRKKGAANWGNKSESVAEMDKSQPSHGRDGKISHSTYGSRDKKGSDYFTGKESPGKPVTKKQMAKDALDILKKSGVSEGSEQLWMVSFTDGEDIIKVRASSKQEAIFRASQIAKSKGNPYPSVDWAKPAEQGVAEGSMDEANIQPSSARSRSHIGNLSDPVTNSVVHPSSGKEIGIITMQPSGEYYAQHTASPLAQAQFGTFATKDEAHQFIRNAHAKAMKDGTLSNKWLKAPPMPQFAKDQGVAEVSDKTRASYKEKAQAQVRELEPHAKQGEYRDIAQRMIDRRQRGLERVKEAGDYYGYKEYPEEKILALIRSGNWEANNDVVAGKMVELRNTRTGKTVMVRVARQSMSEVSDPSGLMHAARHLNRVFRVTAKTAEGDTRRYRVKAQSERTAREKFSQHYSQAEIVSVEDVTENS